MFRSYRNNQINENVIKFEIYIFNVDRKIQIIKKT